MKRNTVLDYMKIIGIIMVVINHVCVNMYGFGISLIYMSHMPVFFAVSGFLSYKEVRKKSLGEFVFVKTKRLLVPYLMWSFISAVFNVGILGIRGISFSQMLKEVYLIFVEARSVWFLVQLYISLVLVRLCYEIKRKTHISEYLLFAIVYLSVFLFVSPDLLAFHRFKWLFPILCLGYLGSEKSDYMTKAKSGFLKFGWLALPINVLLIVVWYGWSSVIDNAYYIEHVYNNISMKWIIELLKYNTISILGLLFVLWISAVLSKKKTSIGEWLINKSNYTLDIYVIHKFLIYGLILVLHPLENRAVEVIISVLLTLFIVWFISFMSEKFLRRIKVYSLSVGQSIK